MKVFCQETLLDRETLLSVRYADLGTVIQEAAGFCTILLKSLTVQQNMVHIAKQMEITRKSLQNLAFIDIGVNSRDIPFFILEEVWTNRTVIL